MPSYTQKCLECDTTVVKISKIADRDEQVCDTCGSPLKRQMDTPGMVWSPTRNGGYS